jgi:predicted DNA-binding transcriptional regulator YafY
MNKVLRVFGIILIVLSLLLLIVVPPAGVIGIILGVLCIVRTNKKVAEKLSAFNTSVQAKAVKLQQISRDAKKSSKQINQAKPDEKTDNDKTVFIEYEDIKGNFSDRTIEINRVYKKGGKLYIGAYCFMQGEDRTFLVDRILSMRETRKGPKITDIETYLHQLYKKPPSGPSAADLAVLAQTDDKINIDK